MAGVRPEQRLLAYATPLGSAICRCCNRWTVNLVSRGPGSCTTDRPSSLHQTDGTKEGPDECIGSLSLGGAVCSGKPGSIRFRPFPHTALIRSGFTNRRSIEWRPNHNVMVPIPVRLRAHCESDKEMRRDGTVCRAGRALTLDDR